MVGVGGWEDIAHISLNTGVIQLAQHGSPLEAYTLNILGKLCTGERERGDRYCKMSSCPTEGHW